MAEARRWKSAGREVTVAYPGSPGSLSHLGAMQFFRGSDAILHGTGHFENTFQAVCNSEVDYGVVPMENSSSGTISSIYDLLLQHDVVVDGDLGVHEKYCLCAEPGVGIEDIRSVTSHPVILTACSEFISQKLPKDQDLVATKSTCEAVIETAKHKGSGRAAIATHKAASLHGLSVLATDIGNDVFMETRYILIRHAAGESADWKMPHHLDSVRKHSACFAIPNSPGALFKLMSCFALRDISVTKMETRPQGARPPPGCPGGTGSKLWDQIFYIDYVEPQDWTKEDHNRLWAATVEFSTWQRDFGSYSSLVSNVEKKPQTWDQMYQNITWG